MQGSATIDWRDYAAWAARLDGWLARLPADHPVLGMDELGQCEAFALEEGFDAEGVAAVVADVRTLMPQAGIEVAARYEPRLQLALDELDDDTVLAALGMTRSALAQARREPD